MIKWADAPTQDSLDKAKHYLTLLGINGVALADDVRWVYPAKDLLRAADKPALPQSNAGVAKWLKRIKAGETVPSVLLVPGDLLASLPLTIAEGYHRVSACYLIDEATPVVSYFLRWV